MPYLLSVNRETKLMSDKRTESTPLALEEDPSGAQVRHTRVTCTAPPSAVEGVRRLASSSLSSGGRKQAEAP